MKEAWLAVALAADRWKPSVGAWRSWESTHEGSLWRMLGTKVRLP